LSRSGQVAVVLLGALCGVPPGCALAGTPAAAPPATPDPGSNPAVRAASGPTTGRAPPAAVQDSSCQATVGQRLLDAVNEERGRHGLPSLRPHPELIAAARAHADDQAARGTVTHVGSDGSAGSERVTRASYSWATTGENVAGGYDDPTHVVVAWLDSPPHRAILLEPEAVHAGVGFTQASEDGFRWFWALTVAAPGELEDTPAIRCHP
jgi:uncharacterized protein YkwD